MKNIEAITIYNNLKGITKFNSTYGVKVLHARQKNLRTLEVIVKDYETIRDDLFKKYITEPVDNTEELNKKINENPELIKELKELAYCDAGEIELVKVDIESLPETLSIEEYEMISAMVNE